MRLLGMPPCAAHRDALVDFAAGRGTGPDVRRALAHVDRCRHCEVDLAATSLIVHALRRLSAEASRVEPAADGWARLRLRLVATPRPPSLLLSGLPGLIVAIGLCGALVGPGVLQGDPIHVYDEGAWVAPRTPPAVAFEQGSDRRPAPVLSEVLSAPAAAGPAGQDDLARTLDGLRSSEAARSASVVPDGAAQPAPDSTDRR